MASLDKLILCSSVALLAILSLHGNASASPIESTYVEKRASYWPGMWQYGGTEAGDEDGELQSEKRGYYWPGMWEFDRNRKQFGKRGYYWPGMWEYDRNRKQFEKRGYYWPGMWEFGRGYGMGEVDKRASFWPGMWRYQLRRPTLQPNKRGYERYWLGKACGETGDPYACGILNGGYDF